MRLIFLLYINVCLHIFKPAYAIEIDGIKRHASQSKIPFNFSFLIIKLCGCKSLCISCLGPKSDLKLLFIPTI